MDKKIEDYIKEVDRRADQSFLLAPPLFRILWRCGIKARPPVFQTFTFNLVSNGIIGSLIAYWIISVFQTIWPMFLDRSSPWLIIMSLSTGVSMGWFFAKRYAEEARKQSLPSWEDYNPPQIN